MPPKFEISSVVIIELGFSGCLKLQKKNLIGGRGWNQKIHLQECYEKITLQDTIRELIFVLYLFSRADSNQN